MRQKQLESPRVVQQRPFGSVAELLSLLRTMPPTEQRQAVIRMTEQVFLDAVLSRTATGHHLMPGAGNAANAFRGIPCYVQEANEVVLFDYPVTRAMSRRVYFQGAESLYAKKLGEQ